MPSTTSHPHVLTPIIPALTPSPPQTSLAALYNLLSLPIFYSHANLGLLLMTTIDTLSLLAFTIISVLLGRPLSFLNCALISNASASANAASAYAFTTALASSLGKSGAAGLGNLAGSTKVNCYESKAVWGLCVALCVLYACSAMILPTLWWKARRAGGAGGGKSVV